MLDNIVIVLCDTTHTGNIGSTARAMKTMGITDLVLVSPKAIIDEHTSALACNAWDVVKNAKIVSNLEDAIRDATIAVALTSRRREFNHNLFTPKEIVSEIYSIVNQNLKVAIVFGSEKNGLTISQLEQCNRIVTIPGNPEYFSLNLSQAVQIICYEIYSNYNNSLTNIDSNKYNLATIDDNIGVINHFKQILTKINFYDKKNSLRVDRRIQSIVNKASLEREDIDLLRGILKKIEQSI